MLDSTPGILADSRSSALSVSAIQPDPNSLFPLLSTPIAASSSLYGTTGLKAEYFNDPTLSNRVFSRTDATIDFDWGSGSPNPAINADSFSARWSGQVLPFYSEQYTFYTQGDDKMRLWVNNQLLIDDWDLGATRERSGTIALEGGQAYDIRFEFAEEMGGAVAKLLWSSSSQSKDIIGQSQLFSPYTPSESSVKAASIGSDATVINPFDVTPITGSLNPDRSASNYRFTLNDSTFVNFNLDNLGANVDLKLLGTQGDVIGTSANGGTTSESIAAVLAAGTYLLQAYSSQPVSTGYTLSSAIAQSIREPAKSADSFVDSIGVATHLRYTDTSYGQYSEIVEPRLRELGIRHIRDGGSDPTMYAKMRQLATYGIKSTLVMDPRDNITPDTVVQQVQQALPAVEAVEGPNEWDVNSANMSYKGKSFPDGLREYQADLYRAIKSNPITAHLSVLAPSMAYPENGQKVGSMAAYSDYGNMHSYAGGNVPGQDFDWRWMPLTKAYAGDRPIIVTETGYHTAVNDLSAPQKAVSEQVAAKYLPRTVLEYFNRGIKRTFLYELLDQRQASNQENNFGLVRADGSAKPAFYALRNLIGLLNDTPGSTASGSLSYYFTGDVKNLRHTLLQKSNGDFYLVLWINSESTDTPKTQRVTVNLLTPTQQAATYLPNRSIDATATFTAPTRITMDVPDAPLVVKLTPKS